MLCENKNEKSVPMMTINAATVSYQSYIKFYYILITFKILSNRLLFEQHFHKIIELVEV